MRTASFTIAFSILTVLTAFAQTKINGNYIQPYSIVGTSVSFTPTSQPIGTLTSSSRTLQLHQTDYKLKGQDGNNYSAILIKEGSGFKAYKYNSFGPIEKFEVTQLNGTGLPELIIYTSTQNGNAYWFESDKYVVIIDFDANKVLWDLSVGYSYDGDTKKNCSQSISLADGKITIGSPSGNLCNPTNNDVITEYKKLFPGIYQYKDGMFYLPDNAPKTYNYSEHSNFEKFWTDFKSAVASRDKNAVAKMTNTSDFRDEAGAFEYNRSGGRTEKPLSSNSQIVFLSNYDKLFVIEVVESIKTRNCRPYKPTYSQLTGSTEDIIKKGEYLLSDKEHIYCFAFAKIDGVFKLSYIPMLCDE